MRPRLTIVIGPTGAGKSSLVDSMVENGYTKVLSYTTRPPRPGEKDGVEYNFSTFEAYKQAYSSGNAKYARAFVIPSTRRQHFYWFMATDLVPVTSQLFDQDVEKNYVMIMDEQGLEEFTRDFGDVAFVIFVDAPQYELARRAHKRASSSADAEYRLEKEAEIFDRIRTLKKYDLRVSTVDPELDLDFGPSDEYYYQKKNMRVLRQFDKEY